MTDDLGSRARTAHGDAWQAHGRLRAHTGGGATEIPGARLMASGLPHPAWNNADLTDGDVDVAALVAWYADRRVPWGIRVPPGVQVDLGRPLFHKRCAVVLPQALQRVPAPAGVAVRRAGREDLERYAVADATAFDEDLDLTRRWIEPMLGHPSCTLWLAEAAGEVVGVASVLRTDDRAGPAAYLTGVGFVPDWAGRESTRALTAVAAEAALADGADVVHTNPDDDDEVAALASLGFVEVPGFDVRLVVGPDDL